jgi:hypothetical protein
VLPAHAMAVLGVPGSTTPSLLLPQGHSCHHRLPRSPGLSEETHSSLSSLILTAPDQVTPPPNPSSPHSPPYQSPFGHQHSPEIAISY